MVEGWVVGGRGDRPGLECTQKLDPDAPRFAVMAEFRSNCCFWQLVSAHKKHWYAKHCSRSSAAAVNPLIRC